MERGDFAIGTSSSSSKLVHGGIRYLEQKEFGLVREALAERQIALRNAPHLVHVMPFLIPVLTRDGLIDRRIARLLGGVLWMYDLSGGLRIKKAHRAPLQAMTRWRTCPRCARTRVASAYLYFDAQADDARLTLAIARTAVEHGAVAVESRAGRRDVRAPSGASPACRSTPTAAIIDIRARVVVNAGGVWSDEVRALDEGTHPASLRPAKGVHISVPWDRVRNEIAMVVPVAGDRRSIFVVPWGDAHLHRHHRHRLRRSARRPAVHCRRRHVPLDAVNRALVDPLTEDDVVGTWAGLRPLLRGGRTSAPPTSRAATASACRARRRHDHRRQAHHVPRHGRGHHRPGRPAARRPAPALSHQAAAAHRRGRVPGATRGWVGGGRATSPRRYGTEASAVQGLIARDPALGEPLVPGLPYVKAEAVFAVRSEMARTLDDVLDRRTRARMLDHDAHVDRGRVGGPSASRPSSGGTTTPSPGRSTSTAAELDAERPRPRRSGIGCP